MKCKHQLLSKINKQTNTNKFCSWKCNGKFFSKLKILLSKGKSIKKEKLSKWVQSSYFRHVSEN